MFHKAFSIALPKGGIGQGSSSVPPNNMSCWNSNKPGHWARNCPYPKKKKNQKPGNPNAHQGHVHYTTLEEIPLGEVVTVCTFLVYQHPIVVLFDFGASHSFTSQIFASKHDQRIVTVDKGGYCISVARNNISTNQIVRDVRILISNPEYTSNLVVLLGLGIDVILGMKWMSGHGVLIDTSTRTMMLREPQSNNAFLVPLTRSFDLQNLACAI